MYLLCYNEQPLKISEKRQQVVSEEKTLNFKKLNISKIDIESTIFMQNKNHLDMKY